MATDLNTRIMAALSEAVRATRFLPFDESERRLHDIAADCEVDVRDIVRSEVTEVRFGNTPESGVPVEQCEAGCGPATTTCSEGIPLCDRCAWALDREVLDEIAQIVEFDRAVHGDLVTVVKERIAPSSESQLPQHVSDPYQFAAPLAWILVKDGKLQGIPVAHRPSDWPEIERVWGATFTPLYPVVLSAAIVGETR